MRNWRCKFSKFNDLYGKEDLSSILETNLKLTPDLSRYQKTGYYPTLVSLRGVAASAII